MKISTAIIILLLLTSCFDRKPELTGLEGKTMPNFSILLSDSSTWFNTSSISTGQPSCIFLFNPHCPYCKAQIKEIINDQNKLNGIHFYALTSYSYAEMKLFANEFQLNKYSNFTVGLDTSAFTLNYFGAAGVPFTAIYDANKKLSRAYMGQISTNDILSAVKLKQ